MSCVLAFGFDRYCHYNILTYFRKLNDYYKELVSDIPVNFPIRGSFTKVFKPLKRIFHHIMQKENSNYINFIRSSKNLMICPF